MGRPSLAEARRRQIVDALVAAVAARGYEATTVADVAARAGVARPIIRHYFGNREALLADAVRQLTAAYRDDYRALAGRLPAARRPAALLDYLFGGRFTARPSADAAIDALVAASPRDAAVRASLRRMYRAFEHAVYRVIVDAWPHAAPREARRAAYAVMCLAEQHATFRSLGIGARRTADARAAAAGLLRSAGVRRPRKEPH
jgi:AcrR family transcriptional regulator